MGFRFIVLTYPHTHTHISWRSDRNIGAVYYVVGADKNQNAWSAAYSRIIWWMSIKCYDAIWIYRHFFTFSSRVTLTFAFMDPKSIPECLEVVTCTKISDHRYHRFWLGAVTDGRVKPDLHSAAVDNYSIHQQRNTCFCHWFQPILASCSLWFWTWCLSVHCLHSRHH